VQRAGRLPGPRLRAIESLTLASDGCFAGPYLPGDRFAEGTTGQMGDFSAAGFTASDKVRGLDRAENFNGKYTTVGAGLTVLGDGSAVTMRTSTGSPSIWSSRQPDSGCHSWGPAPRWGTFARDEFVTATVTPYEPRTSTRRERPIVWKASQRIVQPSPRVSCRLDEHPLRLNSGRAQPRSFAELHLDLTIRFEPTVLSSTTRAYV
jgi:hypothetical protein